MAEANLSRSSTRPAASAGRGRDIWQNVRGYRYHDFSDLLWHDPSASGELWMANYWTSLLAGLPEVIPGTEALGRAAPSVANERTGISDRVVRELGRLRDGWEGDGSIAPSEKTILQVEGVLDLTSGMTDQPEIEVDSSVGSVTLRWWFENNKCAFAIVCMGRDEVVGVHTSSYRDVPNPWTASMKNEIQFADRLEQSIKRQLLDA